MIGIPPETFGLNASRTQAEETRAIRFRIVHQIVVNCHPMTMDQLLCSAIAYTVPLAFGLKVASTDPLILRRAIRL